MKTERRPKMEPNEEEEAEDCVIIGEKRRRSSHHNQAANTQNVKIKLEKPIKHEEEEEETNLGTRRRGRNGPEQRQREEEEEEQRDEGSQNQQRQQQNDGQREQEQQQQVPSIVAASFLPLTLTRNELLDLESKCPFEEFRANLVGFLVRVKVKGRPLIDVIKSVEEAEQIQGVHFERRLCLLQLGFFDFYAISKKRPTEKEILLWITDAQRKGSNMPPAAEDPLFRAKMAFISQFLPSRCDLPALAISSHSPSQLSSSSSCSLANQPPTAAASSAAPSNSIRRPLQTPMALSTAGIGLEYCQLDHLVGSAVNGEQGNAGAMEQEHKSATPICSPVAVPSSSSSSPSSSSSSSSSSPSSSSSSSSSPSSSSLANPLPMTVASMDRCRHSRYDISPTVTSAVNGNQGNAGAMDQQENTNLAAPAGLPPISLVSPPPPPTITSPAAAASVFIGHVCQVQTFGSIIVAIDGGAPLFIEISDRDVAAAAGRLLNRRPLALGDLVEVLSVGRDPRFANLIHNQHDYSWLNEKTGYLARQARATDLGQIHMIPWETRAGTVKRIVWRSGSLQQRPAAAGGDKLKYVVVEVDGHDFHIVPKFISGHSGSLLVNERITAYVVRLPPLTLVHPTYILPPSCPFRQGTERQLGFTVVAIGPPAFSYLGT